MKRASLVAISLLSVVLFNAPSSGAETTQLLPNLAPLPPEELLLPGTAFFFGGPTDVPFTIDGCLIDEKIQKGAQRCLRFDTSVANSGDGPFEVIYRAETSGETTAYQRIYSANGSSQSSKVTASEFHPTHLHFHIKDFYIARLWAAKPNGRPMGLEPVATSSKNGFCPEDTRTLSGEEEPEHYNCVAYPLRTDSDGATPGTVVGISSGWMDTYPANLPDQFIDIKGIVDGAYVLQITIDPNDVFEESNEIDNTICTLIEIASEEVTAKFVVPCGRRRSPTSG